MWDTELDHSFPASTDAYNQEKALSEASTCVVPQKPPRNAGQDNKDELKGKISNAFIGLSHFLVQSLSCFHL